MKRVCEAEGFDDDGSDGILRVMLVVRWLKRRMEGGFQW